MTYQQLAHDTVGPRQAASINATPNAVPGAAPDLVPALVAAEDAVARLDERLAKSPIAAAFSARTHMLDAAAAVFLEGELVGLDDLVLHDAAADIRAPTHALTRAHAALRARRRLAAAASGWALTQTGLDTLRGAAPDGRLRVPDDAITAEEDAFAAELAAIDALIARFARVLAGTAPPPAAVAPADALPLSADALPLPAAADPTRQDRLAACLATMAQSRTLTPVLAAASAAAAFEDRAPFPNDAWLGCLAAADSLRARGKTRHHLAALNLGLKLASRDRRRPRPTASDRSAARLAKWILAITCAAEAGLADHDRWLTARHLLERKLRAPLDLAPAGPRRPRHARPRRVRPDHRRRARGHAPAPPKTSSPSSASPSSPDAAATAAGACGEIVVASARLRRWAIDALTQIAPIESENPLDPEQRSGDTRPRLIAKRARVPRAGAGGQGAASPRARARRAAK